MTELTTSLPVGVAVQNNALRQCAMRALNPLSANGVIAKEMPETALFGKTDSRIIVADLAALGDGFGDTIRSLRTQATPPEILVLHHSPDGGAILKAMRAGAREFFFEDIEGSLREAVTTIASETPSSQNKGKLYAFFAAKGGCGVTTLASHTAAHIAKLSKTLFVDLNLRSPSAAFLLRVTPQYNLQDAATNVDRMDSALWKAMVTDTLHGFALAPPPAGNTPAGSIKLENLGALLRFYKTQYESVIVDCGDGVQHLTPAIVNAADEILVVASAELLALHHAKRMLRAIEGIAGTSRARLVLNRVQKRPDVAQNEWETMLGHAVYACVPNDYRAVIQASDQGSLIPEKHPISRSIAALASQLVGSPVAKKKRLFGMFGD